MNNINVLHKQERDRKNLVCYKLSATFWSIGRKLAAAFESLCKRTPHIAYNANYILQYRWED
jgi:hypothetical protein